MRQKSCWVKINFESLFGKPHVGGPCSVCHGGQHGLFCLQSWNVLHFLWTPDRQLARVRNVSLNTRVPLRSEMRTPGGARWAEADWGSWGGCCLLSSPSPWGVRSSGGLAGLCVYVCSLLHAGVTEFWEKAGVTWQQLPACQVLPTETFFRETLQWSDWLTHAAKAEERGGTKECVISKLIRNECNIFPLSTFNEQRFIESLLLARS